MTAQQAFEASATADVYILLDDGKAFIETGMRTSTGLALTVTDGHGVRRHVDLPADRNLVTWIYR